MNEQATEVKKIKFAEKTSEGTVLSFKFGNDTVLTVDLSELSEDMQQNLMVHGALQKIGDSYASAGGDFAFAIAALSIFQSMSLISPQSSAASNTCSNAASISGYAFSFPQISFASAARVES